MYLEKLRLDGRIAVVTGGARGIGAAICEALGEAGATVVITDILEAELTDQVAKLKAKNIPAHGKRLDVTKSADVNRVAGEIAAEFGRVDILVNNAGIAENVAAEDASDAHWRKIMDINVDGVFWCSRAFGNQMLKQGKGSIVNIGSMSGFIVNTPQDQAAYNASKAAVHHLTKSLATEWAKRGVRVNAVAPTYIESEMTLKGIRAHPDWLKTWMAMTPMDRMGRPDEIASVVQFLASDASSLMTGSIVLADGGYCCW